MKLIKKGAEGDVYLSEWNNQKAILKERKKKDYRNSELDNRIRKQRTIRESEIISEVKTFGVPSPLVYLVDTIQCRILMQYLHGKIANQLSDVELVKKCREIGSIVGMMHKNGIMHGDLTTSNFIQVKGKIFVIDFGLSIRTKKPEDHAVDLRLFKEILNSAHASIMEKCWKNFLSGYKAQVGKVQFSKIKNLVALIESRGRYATVV